MSAHEDFEMHTQSMRKVHRASRSLHVRRARKSRRKSRHSQGGDEYQTISLEEPRDANGAMMAAAIRLIVCSHKAAAVMYGALAAGGGWLDSAESSCPLDMWRDLVRLEEHVDQAAEQTARLLAEQRGLLYQMPEKGTRFVPPFKVALLNLASHMKACNYIELAHCR